MHSYSTLLYSTLLYSTPIPDRPGVLTGTAALVSRLANRAAHHSSLEVRTTKTHLAGRFPWIPLQKILLFALFPRLAYWRMRHLLSNIRLTNLHLAGRFPWILLQNKVANRQPPHGSWAAWRHTAPRRGWRHAGRLRAIGPLSNNIVYVGHQDF